MTRSLLAAALPISVLLNASVASAQDRCLATYYKLPASIADEMRPYLICGLMDRQTGDPGTVLNGVLVSMGRLGSEPANCGQVRSRAFAAADQHLASIRMRPSDRKSYLDAEFKKAAEFLRTTTKLGDLGIGEEPTAPRCRTQNAQH
jgi:hypothetical protein